MKPQIRRIIVNADDLGRTDGINSGIFAAHDRGVVTSATLMVGFDAAIAAAAELPRHPGLGIGLHVTLSGGSPLLPPELVTSLVDTDGRFPPKPDGLTGAVREEIRAEVEAQFEKFVELTGRLPTHLDSHHHSHRLPDVCDALISLAMHYRLPVRNASPTVGERLRAEGVPTTDWFIEDFFGQTATLDSLLQILDRLKPGVSEIMCHPAQVDDALRQGSSYVDERETELEALAHPDVLAALQAAGIELIDFTKL